MKGMETVENNFSQDWWFSGSGSNCGSFEKRRYERVSYESVKSIDKAKGKAILLQAWTGPKGSRRLRLLDFKTFGTWRW